MTTLTETLSSITTILAAMAALAAIESLLPLRARGAWNRAHLGPNLALTFLTFATNAPLSAGLAWALAVLEPLGFGLLPQLALPPLAATLVSLLALDLSFYVCHVAMHHLPAFWRFHRVHHADPAVDVTTTIRQHPGESLIRYAFTAAFALPLGVSPAAFALYRVAVALSGLLEHANFRLPAALDRALSCAVTWPNVHKLHHSREARFTNTNYGNLVSLWDRLFRTFTPSRLGTDVDYGLAGFDDAATQTTRGLLGLPFRRPTPAGAPARSPSGSRVRRSAALDRHPA